MRLPATVIVGLALSASTASGAEGPASSPHPTSMLQTWRTTRSALARRAPRSSSTAPRVPPVPPEPISDPAFNDCKKRLPGKRDVLVPLKPDTDVNHLILWISSVTCKAFVWSGPLIAGNRKVTLVAPALVTPKQAFNLFLDALNSVGLTVQPSGGFSQIIETARARSRPVPVYDWAGRRLAGERP